ncbi:MAG TPA: hypothetical protein VFJ43_03185 [Bacteroidia bacterium]|nr:hypothetical protein [Bacteroidia bacterium]
MKTITILQYQGHELLGTTTCSFDSTGKKRSETLNASFGKFPTIEKYIYNDDGLLTEIRENDSIARSRTFFKYDDTLKISREEFDEFYDNENRDSISGFFSMTEEELSHSDKLFPVNTNYFYDGEKLSSSEADGMENGKAATLRTAYFYLDDGRKRAEITKVASDPDKGTKTEEIDYEYSPDGKTMTENHNYFGKDAYELDIIYHYNEDGILLTKEFKSKKEIFQKHVYKYDYYN